MKKKKSGKRIFAIVLLVVIGIGGFTLDMISEEWITMRKGFGQS